MNGAKAPETPSPVLQEKTVTPETLPIVIGADEGYTGLSQVTVNPDTNLKAENIRSGKTIFGVEGVFGGGDSGLVLADIKPYVRANVVWSTRFNGGRNAPCTVEVTSAELTSVQGGQSANYVEFVNYKFDYDNASYTYLDMENKSKYQSVYGKMTVNVTVNGKYLLEAGAEKDSPPVTEAYVYVILQNLTIICPDGSRYYGYLAKIPSEIPAITTQRYENLTHYIIDRYIDFSEITVNNLEFIVTSTEFDPEKALTATEGNFSPQINSSSKVVK